MNRRTLHNVDSKSELLRGSNSLRGVRQGCVISLLLFSIYSQRIFYELCHDVEEGIKINCIYIINIRCADDIVLIASRREKLHYLLGNVNCCNKLYCLNINIKKTVYMIVRREGIIACDYVIENNWGICKTCVFF